MLERIKSRLSVELTEENYHYMLRQFNQIVAHEAMVEYDGNVSEASRKIGVSRRSFDKYLGCSGKEWNNEFNGGEYSVKGNPQRVNGKYRWEK